MFFRYLDSMNKKPIKEQEACVDKATIAGDLTVFAIMEYFQFLNICNTKEIEITSEDCLKSADSQ